MYSHQASSTENGERDTAVRRGRQTHIREYIGGRINDVYHLLSKRRLRKSKAQQYEREQVLPFNNNSE